MILLVQLFIFMIIGVILSQVILRNRVKNHVFSATIIKVGLTLSDVRLRI